MLFKDMYDKPIDRPIDAVVKASSVEHLANELDEYVITPELAGHLSRFYDEYNDPDATGNGAWISGFFGSGKSHMLKILATLLEDSDVAGKRALDYILPKLDDDPALQGAMEAARAKHSSESILFNIDTIAPNQGRTEAAALLAAFIKVFNRHCGYFDGDQQHIAKLEYDLDREGMLEDFAAAVEAKTGKPWTDVRKSALLYGAKVTAAFDEVCGNPPGTTDNVVKYYQQTYRPDIHSFALRVKEYIDAHGPGFRLNFFVDEVGQFIAQNVNLMVNLQSVAEELNTVCEGSSWVVVTSQENMEDIVGQMTDQSANDFSKIQARFKIKMQLTSKDAKEVIKQRLLAKSKDARAELKEMYLRNEADFRVLFDFADGSKRYVTYADEEDFIDTYPFVPYQFDLFITAMRGLSDYNAFTGRHHSTGARSMLGVFQEVAVELARDDKSTDGQDLATFDSMFEGLRNSLKSEVYGAISIAETNLAGNPMAIRVLKALLLVKYCKDFKATAGNLRVLLYGSFAQNTATLEQKIKDALAELERQLYIRRSADSNAYEYLTDEEKDIEKEIRNTEIQTADVRAYIGEAFRDVVGASKVTYENEAFSHSFPYDLKVDGDTIGRDRNDLTLDVVTDVSNELFDLPRSGPKTLTVVLRGANAFLNDMATYVKTRKYVNVASGAGEVRNAIIADKRQALGGQAVKLRTDFEALLTDARFIAGGVEVTDEVNGMGKEAVANALRLLIKRSYTGLQQLKQNFSDNDVYNSCSSSQAALDVSLPEYVETVLSWIGLMGQGATLTVGGEGAGSLIAHFTKDEYGWPEIAVRNAVAMLYSANRVEVRKMGALVEGTELASILKNGRDMDKLVVSKVADVSADRMAQLNSSFRGFVGTRPMGADAKAVAGELVTYLEQEIPSYRTAKDRAAEYPFSKDYDERLEELENVLAAASRDWRWVPEQFPERAEELSIAKNELSSMKQFMNGSPLATKWEEIKEFRRGGIAEARDLDISLSGDLEAALTVIDDPECYKSREIPRIAGIVKRVKTEIEEAKKGLRSKVIVELEDYRKSFKGNYDFNAISQSGCDAFEAIFNRAIEEVDAEQSAYRISAFMESFKRANGSRIVSLLTPSAAEPEAGAEEGAEENQGRGQAPSEASSPVTISISLLGARGYNKPMITDRKDIDDYLAALRAELEEQIDNGNIVMR
ncbi:MAG TPA: BREX system P-loop protein BrxC [Collinsella ihuae]|uniref:BREX system P-loop protein BrxC n=1 Tax=Collinsella ihumii TaxID=1720204 RepID=A0A921IR62_9ACTN|nr:BREX system P-loop protein BrxC [Collinsella ihumii]